jgi:hypothetical protein
MTSLVRATNEVIEAGTWVPKSAVALVALGASVVAFMYTVPSPANVPVWMVLTGVMTIVAQVVVGFIRCARKS